MERTKEEPIYNFTEDDLRTKAQIKNGFNRLAEKLGCKARLSGSGKKPILQEFTGSYIGDHEIVIGVQAHRFSQLIEKYPQFHN